jgi:hypothetical protein
MESPTNMKFAFDTPPEEVDDTVIVLPAVFTVVPPDPAIVTALVIELTLGTPLPPPPV